MIVINEHSNKLREKATIHEVTYFRGNNSVIRPFVTDGRTCAQYTCFIQIDSDFCYITWHIV